MISIPRSLARDLRAVFRRMSPGRSGPRPLIELSTGPDGLRVRGSHGEVAAEYHRAGSLPEARILIPLDALVDSSGRTDDPVTLEASSPDKVLACWQDGGIPRLVEYEAADPARQPEFPGKPERLVRNPPGLLLALDRAVQTAATEGVRFAVQRLLLKGRAGEVVATDGHQLLVQGGFTFPWTEDVLVPRVPIFVCRELCQDVPVMVGRTREHVVLRVGAWSFFLRIDADARYPNVAQVIPKVTDNATCWRIGADDAAFLGRALPRLPGQNDENQPVTVDLGEKICVRARASAHDRVTEVVLVGSKWTGKPVRFSVNRTFLARVLQLGLAEVRVAGSDQPLLAQAENVTYVVMPLPKESAVPPVDNALRIVSADGENPPRQSLNPEKKRVTMSASTSNGNGHAGKHRQATPLQPETGKAGFSALIAESDALKSTLRAAYARANQLLAAIKRHRRQAQAVQSTLASLKQLQHIDG